MQSDWVTVPVKTISNDWRQQAIAHQGLLTKPPGALGRLEQLATELAAMQQVVKPSLDKIHICVFAADHGVAVEGVSAFPQAVTVEMVRNFARGGAAINVLARQIGAQLEVVDMGCVSEPGPLTGVISARVAPGSANLAKAAAMDEEQLEAALTQGKAAAQRAHQTGAQLFIGGEMGIANTTSATALACALLDVPASEIVGPGTGLDSNGMQHKTAVIQQALNLHLAQIDTPLEALRRLGGLEIAALTGAYMHCAQLGLPAMIDGFISSAAALCASRIRPGSEQWFFYAHRSAEPGHKRMMAALAAEPLLDLGMRLGEGSGAACAVQLLRSAVALHNEMATFSQAGVSEKAR